jgi:predicted  nucleic acid-binding Zn-ribbon protein
MRLDAAKKDQRAREKDLESVQAKRTKTEGRLYEVKTNREYSAVLAEIEDIKQEKGRVEEEILVLMESHERVAADIKDAESRFKTREAQGKQDEAALEEKLRAVEADLALVRTERTELARQVPPAVLADYDKLLKARGGLALAQVSKPNLCGGCRMTVTPQRLQELRAQSALLPCESCGRYLYWLA